MGVETFEVLNKTTVLLDFQELTIDRIVAINSGTYYQQFVYLQTKAGEATGLYKPMDLDWCIREIGFAREEFAIYGGRYISRAEYDDGGTVIDGEPVKFERPPDFRVRYLTPYNLLLAAHDSPINNSAFDERRDMLMNAILRGEATVEDLVGEVMKLPKRSRH
jgi:hypothetical protein